MSAWSNDARTRPAASPSRWLAAITPSTMSWTTSANTRPLSATATTGPPGSRRIVRGAPGRRGGVRNAGTVSPAARAAAPRRRATVAKRTVGAPSTLRLDTPAETATNRLVRAAGSSVSDVRWPAALRAHPDDRDIWRLALPAFGALVAEPLYVLADTAIVGRLGTEPLAGLAVAGTVLTSAFGVFNFLAYSTTAAVARRIGAREPARRPSTASRGCGSQPGSGSPSRSSAYSPHR